MESSIGRSGASDPQSLAMMYEGAIAEGQFCIHASSALVAVTTVAVALRFLARWRTKLAHGADDWWIGLSLIPLWCLVITGVIMVQQGGMGLPAQYLTLSQSEVFYKVLFASTMLYALAITMAKISILLFYRRIFNNILAFRYVIYVVGGFCLLWFFVVVLVSILQCHPVSYAWNKSIDGSCIDLRAMYYSFTISNMVLDVTINIMPVRMIWKLQLAVRQRVLLTIIMLIGIVVIVASVGRIASVKKLASREISATILMPFLYTIIEPAFAIICACLPTYRPLFLWLNGVLPYERLSSNFKSWFSNSNRSTSKPSTSGSSRFAFYKSSSSGNKSNAGNKEAATFLPHEPATEKWHTTRSKEMELLIHEKSLSPVVDAVPPEENRRPAKGIVTKACHSGVFYSHDEDFQDPDFSRKRAGDVSPISSV